MTETADALEYLLEWSRALEADGRNPALDQAREVVSEHLEELRTPVVDPLDIIRLVAQVNGVRSSADGGGRVTLEVGVDAIPQFGRLALMASKGELVAVAITSMTGEAQRPVKRLAGRKARKDE